MCHKPTQIFRYFSELFGNHIARLHKLKSTENRQCRKDVYLILNLPYLPIYHYVRHFLAMTDPVEINHSFLEN